MFCMMRYQCSRLFSSKRWLFVLVIDAFLAVAVVLDRKGTVSYLLTKYYIAAPANIWDVPVQMLCADIMMIIILVTTFVFLVGDAFLRDEHAGRLPMLVSRTRNRATWFVSLIPALFLAAVAFVGAAVVISLGVALLFLPAGWSFSPFLTSTINQVKSLRPFYFLPNIPLSPPLFFAGLIGYLAPALCGIALLSVVISIWWRQTVAVFIPVVWILMVDMSLRGEAVRSSPGGGRFFFSTQLMLVEHWQWTDSKITAALYPFPVAASVIVFGILCVTWSAVGYFSARYVDL